MSPKINPPGKTFKERWPRDAAPTSFFSKSSSAFLYLLLVLGSIGIAVLIDRAGDALRRRAPSPASP